MHEDNIYYHIETTWFKLHGSALTSYSIALLRHGDPTSEICRGLHLYYSTNLCYWNILIEEDSLLSHHPPSCSRAALLVWYSCLVCHFLASLSNVLAPNWPRGPNWLLHANLDSSPISIDLNIRSHLKSNSVLKVERQNSLFLSKLSSYVTRVLPRTLNAPFTVTPELTPSSYPHTDPSWPTILKKSKKLWHNRL